LKTEPPKPKNKVREKTFLLKEHSFSAKKVLELEVGVELITIGYKEDEDTIWINATNTSGYYTGWISAEFLE
jgi:hypothetical protein